VAPYYPVTEAFDPELSLSEKDMEDLQSWGFNVVRVRRPSPASLPGRPPSAALRAMARSPAPAQLGVMWPGVAPSNGTFNQTYLDAISSIITKLGKYGIYTIVGRSLAVARPCPSTFG